MMYRILGKKPLVIAAIAGFLALSAFTAPGSEAPNDEGRLRVLPKHISHDDLMAVMHGFEHALGVKCKDCHAPSKTKPGKLDFASDENPKKAATLEMMKMTQRINGRFFGVKGDFTQNFISGNYKVSCYSCHHGQKEPAKAPPSEEPSK